MSDITLQRSLAAQDLHDIFYCLSYCSISCEFDGESIISYIIYGSQRMKFTELQEFLAIVFTEKGRSAEDDLIIKKIESAVARLAHHISYKIGLAQANN